MPTIKLRPNGKGSESTTLLLIYIVTIFLLVLFNLSSCKSPEKIMDKAYKTVSTDPAPATEKRKAQLASWVAANFPAQEKVIEKEVIKIEIDTTQYAVFRAYIRILNKKLKDKDCPELNADSIFNLAKETIKPEVITKTKTVEKTIKDTTGNWLNKQKEIELIGIIGKLNAEKQDLKSKLEQSEIKSAKKDKWLWYFIGMIVIFILYHVLRSKLKTPF